MYFVTVETTFSASHRLFFPDGKKEKLHNHKWIVSAEVSSRKLDSMGLVVDFHQLRAMVNAITADFAGKALDKFEYFRRNGSSAEMVAKYIYETLAGKLPKNITLVSVSVVEEAGCSAKFRK